MMLPTLISVPLAPGSYFGSACAALTATAALAAIVATRNRPARLTGMVSSRPFVLSRLSQAEGGRASLSPRYRSAKRHCWARSFVFDASGRKRKEPQRDAMTAPDVHLVNHPLVQHKLSLMREKDRSTKG